MRKVIVYAVLFKFSDDMLIRATGSGSARLSALYQIAIDNAVKSQPIIKSALSQSNKIFHCVRSGTVLQSDCDGAIIFYNDVSEEPAARKVFQYAKRGDSQRDARSGEEI